LLNSERCLIRPSEAKPHPQPGTLQRVGDSLGEGRVFS